jgi:hypothetical protein
MLLDPREIIYRGDRDPQRLTDGYGICKETKDLKKESWLNI